jgi:hypothetical protein
MLVQRNEIMKVLLFMLISVLAVSTEDGWATRNSELFYGQLKNCDKCFVEIRVEEGYNNIEGKNTIDSVYQTNTWSAAFFMRDTMHFVTVPPNLGMLQTTTFVPWYNCGLSIISISLETPLDSMDELEPIARHLQCFDINTGLDNDSGTINETGISSAAPAISTAASIIVYLILMAF